MVDNICKFVSTRKHDEGINIINFVYEKTANFKQEYILLSTYSLALVTYGEGILHTSSANFSLKKGDLFFTFSAKPFYIENTGDLKYIYISFIGLRSTALLNRLKISYALPVFCDFEFLIPQWETTFSKAGEENADLFAEGLLLHTLAFLCKNTYEENVSEKANSILQAKQYVDMNFTDCNLSLKTISQKFSYNPKYFSSAFKATTRINFTEYLKSKRLSYAVTLIESGITNIKDLSELCGYSDPLYFSKCFKQKYGVSPKIYNKYYLNK